MRRYCSLDFCCLSLLLVMTAVVVVLPPAPVGRPAAAAPPAPPAPPQGIVTAYEQASGLSFEPNVGQTDPRVRYIAHGAGPLTFLMPDEMVARVGGAGSDEHQVVEMKVVGANPQAEAEELDPRPGRFNHFVGNDPAQWRRGTRRFGRVKFNEVYPGIDLVYCGSEEPAAKTLEYDFIVNPGADPGRIRLRFDGVDAVRINADGDLTLRTPAGELRQRRPVVYQQMADARRPVTGSFDLSANGEVRFALGRYDARLPLVIDPKVEYSTYLGGSGDDQAFGIAAGPDGSIYVTGYTASVNFPDVSAKGGVDRDVIVTRISREDLPGSRTLLYSTIIGGIAGDQAQDIAVDREGNAYITGWTASANFPKTDGSTAGGGVDSFTLALNASGDLVFGGRTGGSGDDRGWTIDSFRTESSAVEDVVRIITGGETRSRNLKTTADAFQPAYGGGDSDGFLEVLRLDPTAGSPFTVEDRGTSYLGGDRFDIVDSIKLGKFSISVGLREAEYDLFAASTTSSTDMFVNDFAPRINFAGGTDAHFTALRLDPTFGNTFGQADPERFGTFLPSGAGAETEVRVKGFRDEFRGTLGGPIPKDRVFFFYNSRSNDIPTAENALLPDNPGGTQSFVGTVLESNLEAKELRFIGTTYGGGSQFDQVAGMAVDPNGAPAVIGLTFSQLPTSRGAIFSTRRGTFGGFVNVFSKDLTRIDYSTYMWGNANSNVTDIDFDAFGQILITGINGTGALTTPGAFQPNFGGAPWDITVAQITRPFLFDIGIGNGASFRPGASPQQISIAVGGNIGPAPPAFLSVDEIGNLLEQLGDASVIVDGEASPMTFASQIQNNFIYRSSVGFRFLGEKGAGPPVVDVQVEFEGDLSNIVAVPVMEANPGLFAADGSGQGQGAILNPDFTANGAANPAPGNSFIVVFGTGGGITDPICPDGGFGPGVEPLPRLQLPVRVLVDGDEVDFNYAGSAPGLVCGVNQFNVIPTNNPSGPAVPIQVCVNEVCSNVVTAAFE